MWAASSVLIIWSEAWWEGTGRFRTRKRSGVEACGLIAGSGHETWRSWIVSKLPPWKRHWTSKETNWFGQVMLAILCHGRPQSILMGPCTSGPWRPDGGPRVKTPTYQGWSTYCCLWMSNVPETGTDANPRWNTMFWRHQLGTQC